MQTLTPVINSVLCSGTSLDVLIQFAQNYGSAGDYYFTLKYTTCACFLTLIVWFKMNAEPAFPAFDYGREKNLFHYGTENPLQYDLSKVTVPVNIYYFKRSMRIWILITTNCIQTYIFYGTDDDVICPNVIPWLFPFYVKIITNKNDFFRPGYFMDVG